MSCAACNDPVVGLGQLMLYQLHDLTVEITNCKYRFVRGSRETNRIVWIFTTGTGLEKTIFIRDKDLPVVYLSSLNEAISRDSSDMLFYFFQVIDYLIKNYSIINS